MKKVANMLADQEVSMEMIILTIIIRILVVRIRSVRHDVDLMIMTWRDVYIQKITLLHFSH